MHWLLVIAVLFFLFLSFPREVLAILVTIGVIIPVAWVTSLVAGWLPDTSAAAQHDGEIVIIVLGAVVVVGILVAAIRQFVRKWFTPEHGRLLYFLLFLLALFIVSAEVRQPAAQPEHASPAGGAPAEKALQELLLGDQLTPLN